MALQVEHAPYWFMSVVETTTRHEPPAGSSTIALNQLATLNRVFTRYREATMQLSLCGGLIAAIVVVLFAGPRRALRILIIPALACLVTLGVFGLAAATLNLFHLLALLLAMCLCFDYAIFAADHARRGQPPPPSIRLSGLTTSASFGVLAFSAIPVVSALGSTVAISVLVTLAVLELLPATIGPRADRL
jgi:predicted exporter